LLSPSPESNPYSTAAENAAGKYIIPALTGAGACLGLTILLTARDGRDPTWRLIRCFAGFFSAMLWIAAIADEVVEILQVGAVGMLLKYV
jgi:sodium/potassium/calcium exchanger 6